MIQNSQDSFFTARVHAAHYIREVANRFAVLLSALPVRERLLARMELANQITAQSKGRSTPSLYQHGSVVAKEINVIAGLVIQTLPPGGQIPWGEFHHKVNRYLDGIETVAGACLEMSSES